LKSLRLQAEGFHAITRAGASTGCDGDGRHCHKRGGIVPGSVQATGKNGLVGYLTFVALNEPRAYLGFLSRLLPLQINAHFDGQVDHNRELTPEDLREELRRGLPEHIFGVDRPQLEHPEATQG
jgi:hypothetical protein